MNKTNISCSSDLIKFYLFLSLSLINTVIYKSTRLFSLKTMLLIIFFSVEWDSICKKETVYILFSFTFILTKLLVARLNYGVSNFNDPGESGLLQVTKYVNHDTPKLRRGASRSKGRRMRRPFAVTFSRTLWEREMQRTVEKCVRLAVSLCVECVTCACMRESHARAQNEWVEKREVALENRKKRDERPSSPGIDIKYRYRYR